MTAMLRALLPSGEIDGDAVTEAARLLREGRLVALPTETVYGLGANALDAAAVRRIFVAKGRPTFNPLIVHVLDEAQARALSAAWPAAAHRLVEAFWPGPLSIVVEKSDEVPGDVTGGSSSVALRAPAHPVARAVIAAAHRPIAAPSANRSNAVSPTTAEHVLSSLGGRIDAILDAGACVIGIESTVIDVRGEPTILRPGGISTEAIERVIGRVQLVAAVPETGPRASPGMLARHYAPDAITLLVPEAAVATAVHDLPSSARIGVLVQHGPQLTDGRIAAWESLGDDPVRFARELYAALHRIEAAGVTHVIIAEVPEAADWQAVTDRIARASGRTEKIEAGLDDGA